MRLQFVMTLFLLAVTQLQHHLSLSTAFYGNGCHPLRETVWHLGIIQSDFRHYPLQRQQVFLPLYILPQLLRQHHISVIRFLHPLRQRRHIRLVLFLIRFLQPGQIFKNFVLLRKIRYPSGDLFDGLLLFFGDAWDSETLSIMDMFLQFADQNTFLVIALHGLPMCVGLHAADGFVLLVIASFQVRVDMELFLTVDRLLQEAILYLLAERHPPEQLFDSLYLSALLLFQLQVCAAGLHHLLP